MRPGTWCWPTRSSPRTPAASGTRRSTRWEPLPLSYDKQYLRDWLTDNKLAGVTPAPDLPAEVVEKTREKYLECLQLLVPQK